MDSSRDKFSRTIKKHKFSSWLRFVRKLENNARVFTRAIFGGGDGVRYRGVRGRLPGAGAAAVAPLARLARPVSAHGIPRRVSVHAQGGRKEGGPSHRLLLLAGPVRLEGGDYAGGMRTRVPGAPRQHSPGRPV